MVIENLDGRPYEWRIAKGCSRLRVWQVEVGENRVVKKCRIEGGVGEGSVVVSVARRDWELDWWVC